MTEEKKTLSLGGKGTLSLKGGAPGQQVITQTLARGQSRGVAIEVRKKRGAQAANTPAEDAQAQQDDTGTVNSPADQHLTNAEKDARFIALQKAKEEDERRREEEAKRRALEAEEQKMRDEAERTGKRPGKIDASELRRRELEELERIKEEDRNKQIEADKLREALDKTNNERKETSGFQRPAQDLGPDALSYRDRVKRGAGRNTKTDTAEADAEAARNPRRMTVNQVLNNQYEKGDAGRSLAAVRRRREKARLMGGVKQEQVKQIREVVVPEIITVQELANRMTEKSSDIIKALMKMGVMATINQAVDADTAELIILEFGHKIKRVAAADAETGIEGETDNDELLLPRAPVVTIMGHVDHGKTSLLDALRATDVVAGEAGGITQHIGAYQVTLPSGAKITFLDTPGHAAFSEMRARGANVTDIVVLVVAANDSIMPQTIEALNHAKAAKVPIIVAINKVDLPDANPMKVKQDLLQHDLQVEDMGGDVLTVEVSAKKRMGLEKLEEAILLQAEMLNLRANPNRDAQGTVIESKLEQGRGSVATILMQKGTLNIGDIFVVGAEWGKVRAIIDDKGKQIKQAMPGQPVEVLGLTGTPEAGDPFSVVGDEAKAREVVAYRQRKKKDTAAAIVTGTTFEQLLAQSREGKKELAIVIKGDVSGSIEAIAGSLKKIAEDNTEVGVRILHSGVGGITESDVTLAKASGALLIGFNVRANAQARDMAKRDHIEIRYYNIIYNIIDDVKGMLSGMLSPLVREEYLGQAQMRQIFNITKVGKIAGCMVTAGIVKRGAKVRLLRDDVVIHEGTLKTLKRMKDEVKEVKEGMECGIAFENFEDIREGDMVECFEVKEEARQLD
jgi:translation initiation factor IF-2